MSGIRIDDVLNQVRGKLQELGIKLWEPPYFIEEPQDEILENLGQTFAEMLQLPENATVAAVKELQNSAIDKLRARERFQSTGIASLKVKVPTEGQTDMLNIEIKLTETGLALRELISGRISVSPSSTKIIAKGKVIQDERTLEDQGIANNQQLIALVIDESKRQEASIYDRVAKIKEDAKLLMDEAHFKLENQDGSAIYLPKHEREALVMGMALHQKGRAALSREQHSEALVLFLEADSEFSRCQSKLLESVDNYALLHLDVVWCYFCLKSITQLPDAERRLQVCEDSFRKSYGSNMDRVSFVKGGEGNERALLLRLHLLQAILCFHTNRKPQAQGLLALAESEFLRLKIDENALTLLVDMGYSPTEARIGLRAAGNSVEESINFIQQRREKKSEARKKGREERKLLGKFSRTGVNPNALKQLMEMGFEQKMASMALEKSDNSIERAVVMLQERHEELQLALMDRSTVDVFEDLMSQLTSQGFDVEAARNALQTNANDLQKALETLLGPSSASTSPVETPTDAPGTSFSTETAKRILEKAKKNLDQKMDAEKALKRFREDFNDEEDEYLDLPLLQEEQLILEYKRLLNM